MNKERSIDIVTDKDKNIFYLNIYDVSKNSIFGFTDDVKKIYDIKITKEDAEKLASIGIDMISFDF